MKMSKHKDDAVYVTLPYDFVPFAKDTVFSYTRKNIPGHDGKSGLSGCLHYTVRPCSDLAVEVREKWGGGYFIGGSQIRGKIRSNLEILSAAYQEFINRSPMLYRDFRSHFYKERMELKKGIERAVRVGFLKKVGDEFYVVPARTIKTNHPEDKNFLSIKEHRLVKMGLKEELRIFKWSHTKIEEFDKLQKDILEKTKKIKAQREKLKDKLSQIQNQISDSNYKSALEAIRNNLWEDIKKIIPSGNEEVTKLYPLTVERRQRKAEMRKKYGFMKRNRDFAPYQRNIFYKGDAGQDIEKITFTPSDETPNKAYIFNSNNVPSKRSHYFVLGPEPRIAEYPVPQSVIDGYRQYLKKFHTGDKKKYDIFDNYEELEKEIKEKLEEESKSFDGIIVFFRHSKASGKEELYIGRTPYFKIPYRHQLTQLLKRKEKDGVDYAGALFGFIPEEQGGDGESKMAYKSRLRFGPVDIVGNPKIYCRELLLPTPFASSSAMYLQQEDKGKLQTYEQEKEPQLNGYKYYHILKKSLIPKAQDKSGENMLSAKKIIGHNSITCLKGKIEFRNLTSAELGLLLLSVDVRQLLKSEKYKEIADKYRDKLEQTYDLIGGAKPYGYGKVKIDIQSLEIEKGETDFASLVLEPMEPIKAWQEYIDAYITEMGKEEYFDNVHFERYIQSKLEIDLSKAGPKHINWEIKLGKGYNSRWRLRRNFFNQSF